MQRIVCGRPARPTRERGGPPRRHRPCGTTAGWSVAFMSALACSAPTDGANRRPAQSFGVEIVTDRTAYSVPRVDVRPQFVLSATITNRSGRTIMLGRCVGGSVLSLLERRTGDGWAENHSYACTDRTPTPLAPDASLRDSAIIALSYGGSDISLGTEQLPVILRGVYWIDEGPWPPPAGTKVTALVQRSNEFTVAVAP